MNCTSLSIKYLPKVLLLFLVCVLMVTSEQNQLNQQPTDEINRYNLQPRLLTACTIPGCNYCAVFDTQKCFFCQPGKYLYPTLDVCANRSQVEIGTIQLKNCTISNCQSCVIYKLNSLPFQFCILCQFGYRSLPLENKCAPISQFIDTQEIVAYSRYYVKCPDGCLACSGYGTFTCMSCRKGYSLMSTTNFTIFTYCVKCFDNCETCNGTNPNQCLTCFPGFVLNAGQCVKCTENSCSQCQFSSLGTCNSCKNSLVLANGACQNCPLNCRTCSSVSTCDVCNQGYLLVAAQNGSISCVKCMYGCYDCQSISSCRFCYPGHFQSSQNKCESCGPNCKVCTSNTNCSLCDKGYDSFKGVCIKRPKNCYVMQQNGRCLVCGKLFEISENGECDSDVGKISPYNDTISLKGQCRTGYYEQNNTCQSCSSRHPNCQICSFFYNYSPSTNYSFFSCDQCQMGYFKKSRIDPNCYQCTQPNCQSCQSNDVCLECKDGYFLLQDSTTVDSSQKKSLAQCIKCDDNCKTCYLNSRMCTSCYGNYTLSLQNTCEGEYQVTFTLTFDMDFETAGQKLTIIRGGLAEYLPKQAQIHQDILDFIIKFVKIYKGSTIIQGYVDLPTQQTAKQMHQSVDQAIAQGKSIGSLPVLSASFSVIKKSDKVIIQKGEQKSDMTLILGLTIGLICGLIVIGIVAFLIWKYKKGNQLIVNSEMPHDKNGVKVTQISQLNVVEKGKIENTFNEFGN